MNEKKNLIAGASTTGLRIPSFLPFQTEKLASVDEADGRSVGQFTANYQFGTPFLRRLTSPHISAHLSHTLYTGLLLLPLLLPYVSIWDITYNHSMLPTKSAVYFRISRVATLIGLIDTSTVRSRRRFTLSPNCIDYRLSVS
ncbi:hypothetical protein FRC18_004296 [Serendipita sp. 400]|nr:hypothetical protein FRC18_004296 [Serendipita sp. 400]